MPKAIPARLVRVLSVFRTNLHLLTDPADLLAAEALLGAAPAVLALLDVIDRSPAGPAFARGGVQNFRGLIDNLARSPEEQAAFQTIFETLLRLAARKGAEKGAPEEGLRYAPAGPNFEAIGGVGPEDDAAMKLAEVYGLRFLRDVMQGPPPFQMGGTFLRRTADGVYEAHPFVAPREPQHLPATVGSAESPSVFVLPGVVAAPVVTQRERGDNFRFVADVKHVGQGLAPLRYVFDGYIPPNLVIGEITFDPPIGDIPGVLSVCFKEAPETAHEVKVAPAPPGVTPSAPAQDGRGTD